MNYQDILKIVLWIVVILVVVYLAEVLSGKKEAAPLDQEAVLKANNDYVFDAPYNLDNFEDYENPCEHVEYVNNDVHQTSICPKIKDIFDEKVDKMSGYSSLKEADMTQCDPKNLDGHLGQVVNTDQVAYCNEKMLSGGAIYQRDGEKDIYAYDSALANELAL